MFRKNILFGSGSVGILMIVGITLLTQDLGWAASITFGADFLCKGTTGDDVIRDGNDGQIIAGLIGDDNINSGTGDDDVFFNPKNFVPSQVLYKGN